MTTKYFGRRFSTTAQTDYDYAMSTEVYGPFDTEADARVGTADRMRKEARHLLTSYPGQVWAVDRATAMLLSSVAVERDGGRVEVDGLRFTVYSV